MFDTKGITQRMDRNWVFAFVYYVILDFTTTILYLSMTSVGLERNPVVRYTVLNLGIVGFFILKITVFTVIYLISSSVKEYRLSEFAPYLLMVVGISLSILNTYRIIRLVYFT